MIAGRCPFVFHILVCACQALVQGSILIAEAEIIASKKGSMMWYVVWYKVHVCYVAKVTVL
jgi:hypothetical protein